MRCVHCGGRISKVVFCNHSVLMCENQQDHEDKWKKERGQKH
jgi:hypothetical protein